MKLIAKAKPVRIRILSGGEEHSSLHSLRKNFVWADIKYLIDDGRLEKWLRRIGEEDVAECLVGLDDKKGYTVLKVYNLLFRKDKPFKWAEDVYKESSEDRSLASLIYEISKDSSYTELIRLSKKYKHLSSVFSNILLQKVRSFTGKESPKQLYEIGNFLYEYNKELAIPLIRIADDKGYELARSFINSHLMDEHPEVDNELSKDTKELILAYRRLRNRFINSWGTKKKISVSGATVFETELLDFYNVCKEALWSHNHDDQYRGAASLGGNFFGGLDRRKILYPLYSFIKALLSPRSVAERILQGILNYTPAIEILYAHNKVYEHHGLFLQIGNCEQNVSQLKNIISKLEIFLKDVKPGK